MVVYWSEALPALEHSGGATDSALSVLLKHLNVVAQ